LGVPRTALHDTDELLDAARDLIVEGGPRAAGIRAIAMRSGAPSGSLYHRFGSRDQLVAQAWLRAVRRFQAGFLAALDHDDARTGVANAIRWSVAFTLDHPADTRLLLDHSRKDLLDVEPTGALAADLAEVNGPLVRAIRALAARLYGTATQEAVERVSYALIDLPQAVLRRHLRAGTLTAATADSLAAAIRALVSDAPRPTPKKASRQRKQPG
jgi:AcrR family transcriptional regulator